MKRQTAWNGFYSTLKEIAGFEKQAEAEGHNCNVAKKWKMADMRARRYAKSLVLEHGWNDVHTSKYWG